MIEPPVPELQPPYRTDERIALQAEARRFARDEVLPSRTSATLSCTEWDCQGLAGTHRRAAQVGVMIRPTTPADGSRVENVARGILDRLQNAFGRKAPPR